MPVEPPPTKWQFPDIEALGPGDLVGVGADLEPGTLLSAYRHGIFPMPVEGRLAWWSPEPRAILPIDGLRVTRSLKKACARFEVRVDTAFAEVISACGDPTRPGGWISSAITDAYCRLHELGWAHSVETWEGERLVGGLYGVAVGALFAGESMFHRANDASKVALVALVDFLASGHPAAVLDVQWMTPHLASLGAVEIPRADYAVRMRRATAAAEPPALRLSSGTRPG